MMKVKALLFPVIFFLSGLSHVSLSQSDAFKIEISFENEIRDVLYLAVTDDYSKRTPEYSIIDSVLVRGESVTFMGRVDYPTVGRFFFKKNDGLYIFLLFNDNYQMVMNADSMWKTKIVSVQPMIFGEFENYKKSVAPLLDKMNQATERALQADEIGDEAVADYNAELSKSFVREIDQLTVEFIKNYPDSYFSLGMFRRFFNLDLQERRKVFSSLTETNKTHPLGQRLYFELFQKDSLTAIGSPAVPFLLKDSHDIFYELEDFKGRYLLMFFWATWCDRCINQFIPYRELFYKSQGKPFEIVSVSIEHEQQAWLNYLEIHDLPWINLFDGKDETGWRLFEYYDNRAIPFNVLIGKNGEIVKLNISFEELEELLDD